MHRVDDRRHGLGPGPHDHAGCARPELPTRALAVVTPTTSRVRSRAWTVQERRPWSPPNTSETCTACGPVTRKPMTSPVAAGAAAPRAAQTTQPTNAVASTTIAATRPGRRRRGGRRRSGRRDGRWLSSWTTCRRGVSVGCGMIMGVTDNLRLMAVHAHPDDESSKGAATMARYVSEGVDVHVVTCTGGERGSILNPTLQHDESVLANLTDVRRREMDAAREILGVRQDWLGWVDSGLPEGDPLPPLPEGCFGLMDVEVAAAPLVRLVRSFRPHVMTTYDENGGYPHPDHIMCHKIALHAFEAAADPARYPDAGPPWQPLKLYYNQTFTKARTTALHEGMLARGLESPYGEWLKNWEDREERTVTTHVPCARLLRRAGQGPARPRHPGRPGRSVVPLPAGGAAGGLADRGLRAGPVGGRRPPRPRTTCSPASAAPRWPDDPGADRCGPSVRAVEESNVNPGLLGFVVVALLGVATWLLIRSMNRQIKKIDLPDDAPDEPTRDGSEQG